MTLQDGNGSLAAHCLTSLLLLQNANFKRNANCKYASLKKNASANVEKHGWLNYKLSSAGQLASVKAKDFKRRFFHLHMSHSSRSDSIDIRKRNSVCISQAQAKKGVETSQVFHVLECFKEMQVFGNQSDKNQPELPKSQLVIDGRFLELNDVISSTNQRLSVWSLVLMYLYFGLDFWSIRSVLIRAHREGAWQGSDPPSLSGWEPKSLRRVVWRLTAATGRGQAHQELVQFSFERPVHFDDQEKDSSRRRTS